MLSSKKNLPLLTASEELHLGMAARAGSTDARNELVERNIRLVGHFVRKFTGRGVNWRDIEGEGLLALVDAADAFDPVSHPGKRFAAFASRYIYGRLLNLCKKERRAVPAADRLWDELVDERSLTSADERNADSVWEAIEGATERDERQPMLRHFGLDGRPRWTLEDAAREKKVSRETVRRSVNAAVAKVRDHLLQSA
jgi:RNA polymerase sporulation-specific sigma factor